MMHYSDDSVLDDLMQADHSFEVRLRFADSEHDDQPIYYGDSEIIQLQATDAIFGGNPCIGAVVSKQLRGKIFVGDFNGWPELIHPDIIIPSNISSPTIPVNISWRAYKIANGTNTPTIWHTEGPYYIKSSTYDPVTGCLSFEAADKLVNSDSEYLKISWRTCFQSDEASELMATVAYDIASILGTPWIAASNTLIAANNCQLPRPDDGTTMREILQWIGATCGGNVRLRWDNTYTDGVLEIVPFTNTGELVAVGRQYASIDMGDLSDSSLYWDVCLTGGMDGADHLSTHDEHTIVTCRFQADDPMGTDALCDTILASIRGSANWRYLGYRMSDVLLDMRAEAGDRVSVNVPRYDGTSTDYELIIGQIIRKYDSACAADVSAPDLAKRTIDPYVPESWAE